MCSELGLAEDLPPLEEAHLHFIICEFADYIAKYGYDKLVFLLDKELSKRST